MGSLAGCSCCLARGCATSFVQNRQTTAPFMTGLEALDEHKHSRRSHRLLKWSMRGASLKQCLLMGCTNCFTGSDSLYSKPTTRLMQRHFPVPVGAEPAHCGHSPCSAILRHGFTEPVIRYVGETGLRANPRNAGSCRRRCRSQERRIVAVAIPIATSAPPPSLVRNGSTEGPVIF